MNFGLNKAIGDDETGFRGIHDRPYRIEAWDFLVAGGAIFDHLDYSFTTDHEDGTAKIVDPTPGRRRAGDPPAVSDPQAVHRGIRLREDGAGQEGRRSPVRPRRRSVRALSEPGRAYAIYGHGGKKLELSLELPAGRYQAEWLNPAHGKIGKSEQLETRGKRLEISSPEYEDDVALSIRRIR